MAKNLKLNIKNKQLAGALQLGKQKEKEGEGKRTAKKAPIRKQLPPKEVPERKRETPPVETSPVAPAPEEKAPPPKSSGIVDDFRKPKIIRRKAAPPAVKSPQPQKETVQAKTETAPTSTEPDSSEKGAPKKPSVFKDYRDVRSQRRPAAGRTFDTRDRMGLRDLDDERWRKKRHRKGKGGAPREDLTIRPKELHIRLPITVKDLASEMKLKASQLIAKLFSQGMAVTINDFLDDETTVGLLGQEFDCEITIDTSEEERIQITGKSIKEEIGATAPEKLTLRPPVITFMGHVDHGKTSLIDAIRKSDLIAGEAGAITQHIGAFKCHSEVGDITILDTPGHEAFSAMRERGAVVTDLVVLVIAGDEGMRDQTIEAMNRAKEASVPIVVAINKSDKPGFDPDNVYRQLAEHELLPEAWGGATITVNCSAQTGQGIKELLEMLSLQSEILELKADPSTRARGAVIESQMHKGLGPVATVLVQNGTLRLGDAVVFDMYYARVKTMHDEHGKELQEATPSTPVKITGLSGLPEAGSDFIAVPTEKEGREIAQARYEEHRHKLQQKGKRGLEGLLESRAEKQQRKVLHVLIRADVQGSLEALKQSLQKIRSDKAELNIVSEAVGQISESDIELAAASGAVIVGFHTKVESHAESLIKQKHVTIKLHDIIYHAIDDVKELMRGLLDKIAEESDTGSATIKATFRSSALGLIAGCQVDDGIIKRGQHARVKRGGEVVWKGPIASLKREKEDVKEVSKGLECGILLQGYDSYAIGDTIEAYEITYLEQEL